MRTVVGLVQIRADAHVDREQRRLDDLPHRRDLQRLVAGSFWKDDSRPDGEFSGFCRGAQEAGGGVNEKRDCVWGSDSD